MARVTLVVTLLLLCCAVSQGIVAPGREGGGGDSPASPSNRYSRHAAGDDFFNSVLSDDVQINIIMNQLAIIKLLNETIILSPGVSLL